MFPRERSQNGYSEPPISAKMVRVTENCLCFAESHLQLCFGERANLH
jgi:hypothetical protein